MDFSVLFIVLPLKIQQVTTKKEAKWHDVVPTAEIPMQTLNNSWMSPLMHGFKKNPFFFPKTDDLQCPHFQGIMINFKKKL